MLRGPQSNPVSASARQPVGSQGRRQRILCNAFHMELATQNVPELCSYSASVQGISTSASNMCTRELKEVIESLWDQIKNQIQCNFVFVGQLLFATKRVQDFSLENAAKQTLDVRFVACHSAESLQNNPAAQRVYDYVMRKACSYLMYERVGRRYYSAAEMTEFTRTTLSILKGFSQHVMWLHGRGPHSIIDVTYKPLLKKNIIEVLSQCLPEQDSIFALSDPVVQNEWRRRCNEATVCTLYNNKIYKVKCVHFEMNPRTEFAMKIIDRKTKRRKTQNIPHNEYYSLYYNKTLTELQQPLLEAYPQKSGEQVFLIPELCALTGFTEELRKERTLSTDAMKHGKVSAQERYNSVMKMNTQISKRCAESVSEWGITGLTPTPLEIKARVLDDVEVDFGQKVFKVEDGQFQKWLRNGLQNPVVLDDWLFIYPETDKAVLDIWLQSLRDIGDVAFHIVMSDPKRITVTDQKKDLAGKLEANITPSTQLVLLLTPQADAMRVYQTLKTYTCTRYPVATQVVRSETIRKRQSIAAVLSRIVLQINAKLSGPLWHVDLGLPKTGDAPSQGAFFERAAMVVGVDLYHCEEGFWMGCVASMDPHCASFLSLPYFLDRNELVPQKAAYLQEFLHEALSCFLEKNGCLPHRILVYRGSATQNLYPEIRATEVQSFQHVISNFMKNYHALLTFVVCTKRVTLRFFQPTPNEANIANPESGTVIDNVVTLPGIYNFYLINHACTKGTSSPTHYVVLLDETNAAGGADALQVLTYRLSFMYFNFPGSTKFPAPLMYAQKLAMFSATAVKQRTHHPRLKTSLYYL